MLRQTNLLAEATARQIVQRAMGIINHSVNVMDNNGVIIASGNPNACSSAMKARCWRWRRIGWWKSTAPPPST